MRDIQIKEDGWELTTSANGHLSCDNFNKDSSDIDEIERLLKEKFGNQIKEEHIIISYDCWSGIFIMLNAGFDNYESSDKLISNIYEYLIEMEKC